MKPSERLKKLVDPNYTEADAQRKRNLQKLAIIFSGHVSPPICHHCLIGSHYLCNGTIFMGYAAEPLRCDCCADFVPAS